MRPVALVTGARRGIGRADLRRPRRQGYDVLGCDIAAEGMDETAAAVDRARRALRLPALRRGRPRRRRRNGGLGLGQWGGLEALVNNAGVGALRRGDLLEVTPKSWDRCMDINARAPFFVAQAVARRMVAEGAPKRGLRGMVFISSANAFMAAPDRAEYTASKTAVSMVARCFALRLAEDGIPVHEIRPGVIRTDMTAPVAARYSQRIAEGLSPIRRWGEPEDVGTAIAALLSGAIPSPPATPSTSMAACTSSGCSYQGVSKRPEDTLRSIASMRRCTGRPVAPAFIGARPSSMASSISAIMARCGPWSKAMGSAPPPPAMPRSSTSGGAALHMQFQPLAPPARRCRRCRRSRSARESRARRRWSRPARRSRRCRSAARRRRCPRCRSPAAERCARSRPTSRDRPGEVQQQVERVDRLGQQHAAAIARPHAAPRLREIGGVAPPADRWRSWTAACRARPPRSPASAAARPGGSGAGRRRRA